MTKTLSQLAKLKLEVINYHNHDISNPDAKTGGTAVNDKFLVGLARDACYTSHNSLNFKRKQIADALGDYDTAVEAKNISDIERTQRWIDRLCPELDELQTRHDADLEVYKHITCGETWLPNSRSTAAPKARNFNDLRKRVA